MRTSKYPTSVTETKYGRERVTVLMRSYEEVGPERLPQGALTHHPQVGVVVVLRSLALLLTIGISPAVYFSSTCKFKGT